jgi:tetratricopeptide (TPR) repeat protein
MRQPTVRRHLADFESSGLVRLLQAEPEAEYGFKHVLIQEAAYEALLKADRAELHGRVAATIEAMSAVQRSEPPAAVLSLHYERANLYDKAIHYAIIAGDRARHTYSSHEALGFYERALTMAARAGECTQAAEVQAAYAGRGQMLQVMGEHRAAAANYEAMLAFAERCGDVAIEADALSRLLSVQVFKVALTPELSADLERVLSAARQAGDRSLVARALWNYGVAHRFRHASAGSDYLQQAADEARELAGSDPGMREFLGYVLNDLGIALFVSGRPRRALACLREAATILRELDQRSALAYCLAGSAVVLLCQADAEGARRSASEGLALGRTLENPWGMGYNLWALTQIELDAGRFEAALSCAEEALTHAHTVAFPVFVGGVLMGTARTHIELGQVERAKAESDASVAAFEVMESPNWTAMGQAIAARVLVASGDLSAAEARLAPQWQADTASITRSQGLMEIAPVIAELALVRGRVDYGFDFCDWMLGHLTQEEAWRPAGEMYFWRGRLGIAARRWQDAETDLLLARRYLERSSAASLLWRVDAALAEVYSSSELAAAGGESAAHWLEQALALVKRLAAGIEDPPLRRSFLSRPDVVQLLAKG